MTMKVSLFVKLRMNLVQQKFELLDSTKFPMKTMSKSKKKIQKLLAEKLQLPNVAVCSAFRAGNQPTQRSAVLRSVIASLSSVKYKVVDLKAYKLLQGSSVCVLEDVSKATAGIRCKTLPLLKEIREEVYFEYFSGIEIIAKTKRNAMCLAQAVHLTTFEGSQSDLPTAATTIIHGDINSMHLRASVMTLSPRDYSIHGLISCLGRSQNEGQKRVSIQIRAG